MRILLDECIDRRLAKLLIGHEVRTVPQEGWAGIKNGQLLNLAEAEYEVFVSVDLGIPFQQNLSGLSLAIVLLAAPSNRLADLQQLVPELLQELPGVRQGTLVTLGKAI